MTSLEREMREVVVIAYRTGLKQERCFWNYPLNCLVTITAEPQRSGTIPVRARPVKRRARRKF